MAEQSVRGRFVWHDLITPNQEGAAAFYTDVLGWQTSPWEQDPSYLLFSTDDGPLGGALEQKGGTPHWLPFIATDDLEAVVRDAERLGGHVRTPPTELPNAGRYAVLADPAGAAFGVHWSAEPHAPAGAPATGQFSWHELASTDNRAALEFYQTLFGWEKVLEHDMGPMGIYLIFGRDGAQWGGIFNKGDAGAPGPAYWLGYVRVGDLDAAVERAKARRGSLLAGPMAVPGGDRIAQLMDPHGAIFAVHAVGAGETAAPEEPSRAETGTASTRPAEKAAEKAAKKPASKPSKKKAAAKKATKKAGNKGSKKASKKTGSRRAKKTKTSSKVTKKTAKKSAKKAQKKTAKKAGKKTGKKTGRKGRTGKAKRKAEKRGNKKSGRKAANRKKGRAKGKAKKARR